MKIYTANLNDTEQARELARIARLNPLWSDNLTFEYIRRSFLGAATAGKAVFVHAAGGSVAFTWCRADDPDTLILALSSAPATSRMWASGEGQLILVDLVWHPVVTPFAAGRIAQTAFVGCGIGVAGERVAFRRFNHDAETVRIGCMRLKS